LVDGVLCEHFNTILEVLVSRGIRVRRVEESAPKLALTLVFSRKTFASGSLVAALRSYDTSVLDRLI